MCTSCASEFRSHIPRLAWMVLSKCSSLEQSTLKSQSLGMFETRERVADGINKKKRSYFSMIQPKKINCLTVKEQNIYYNFTITVVVVNYSWIVTFQPRDEDNDDYVE